MVYFSHFEVTNGHAEAAVLVNGAVGRERPSASWFRHAVGDRRYEGPQAATALAPLYTALPLFVNFFQPSFELSLASAALVRR